MRSDYSNRVRLKWIGVWLALASMVAANRPPRFLIEGQSEIVVRLKEGADTPVGSLIYRLRGIDPDGDELKFGIRDQLGSNILRIEAITTNEANIYLVKELDREIRDEYSFVLTLTDGHLGEGNYITQSFLLLVEDVNDNEPIFKPYPSAITVKEDASPGILTTVEATDLDEGAYGQVLYHLQELDGDVENFAIQTVNGKGVIRLTKTLDYERKSLYQLRVLAVDRANQGRVNTGTAAILVKVQDVEDQPPEFVVASPVTRISEDAEIGTSVLQGGEEHFDIDSSSGIVYTVSQLDREDPKNSNGAYILEILATEESRMVSPMPSATTEVTVIVTDVNDESPRFRSEKYVGEVLENAQQNTPITFLQDAVPEVFDYDQLFLQGDNGIFDVTPFKGINEASFLIRVNDPSFLDYEKVTVMNFSLIAKEIVTNNPKIRLYLNPISGVITVKVAGGDSFDRELISRHYLTVEARDDLGKGNRNTAQLIINIDDVNDNAPMFLANKYEARLLENEIQFENPLVLEARDIDLNGTKNSHIEYSIVGGDYKNNFSIDPNLGIITPIEGLDFEQIPGDNTNIRPIHLTVKARDSDGSSPNNRVVYRIQRGASDKFVIDSRSGVVSVALDGGIGDQQLSAAVLVNVGTLIYRAQAHDPDDQPVLRYAIDKDASIARDEDGVLVPATEYDHTALWDLNAVDGTLRVVRLLDREKIETIKLVLTVEDMAAVDGNPRQTASATLTIIVEDENDNNPKFRKPFYRTSIPENSKNGANIATAWINVTVKAVDSGVPPRYAVVDLFIQVLDENDNNPYFETSSFEYRVREDVEPGTTIANILARDADSAEYGKITYLLDRMTTQGKFLINADTGVLTVSDWLDRETRASYPLVVEAWDNYQFGYLSGESRNAFKQIVEFHKHREPIVAVSATDADDNASPNGRVQFTLVGGKGHELFRFEQVGGDANTGRLFAKQSLKDRFGNYSLTVEAKDLGSPPNVVRGELRLCVTDFNDHAPVFVHPPQNVTIKVPENATIGTTVVEVRAIDADIGANGAVRYRIRRDAGGAWRAFSVHATSGALRTAAPLRRDLSPRHQLRIEAYDLGLPTPLSSDLDLTIYIQDVDSYRPRFPDKRLHINLTENMYDEELYLPSVIERDEIDRGDEPVLPVLATQRPLDREKKANYTLTILATEDCVAVPKYQENVDAVSTLKVYVTVNDLNDNAPKFARKIFTGGITTEADFGIEFMHVKAIDLDEGDNAKINYYLIGDVKKTLTEGLENLAVSPFLVNEETGAISLNFDPQKGMKGYFDFKVLANDTGGLQDEAHVFIYLLREDQRVRFVLRAHPSEVRDKISIFRDKLAQVSESVVNIDDLRVHENKDGSVDNTKTDLYLHLVNGQDHSVLEVNQVLQLVDKNIEQLDDLFKPAEYQPLTADTITSNQTVFWLVWTTLFLTVLLVLSLMMCLSQRADYVRRLKAATATAYSSPTPGESDMTIRSSGGRVPNTNKHSSKGSNPIWLHAYENEWYKSDDQISHSERDSLDENAVNQDLSNEKPYFITTGAFPSIDSSATEPQTNQAKYDFYQQLEKMKNAKNMETTEL
ncbi:hypothetical protein MSG28_006460 [Choristoneura fumiferana]|uniref:Uncharacterized protein n=1 Tax=Choristoneura fumiferana TaxID=7141 RepID=A0ACC0JF31_CHOFU|nr:hypothetical protein MSG28_006460 [Choristoneura fumiferana]